MRYDVPVLPGVGADPVVTDGESRVASTLSPSSTLMILEPQTTTSEIGNQMDAVTLPAKIGETLYASEISVQGGEMNH
jgi:hypothetical protein